MARVVKSRIPEIIIPSRRLGRHIVHDPRSRDYELPQAEVGAQITDVEHAVTGLPLDQGQVGKCTAEALAGTQNTEPNWDVHLQSQVFGAARGQPYTDADTNALYTTETANEGFPWPQYDPGGSGLAVCKAALQMGWITRYWHCFHLERALRGLMIRPVMFGLPWYKKPVLELWSSPALFDKAARVAARLGTPFGGSDGFLPHLSGMDRYQNWRSLPVPAKEPARDRLFGGQTDGVPDAPSLSPPLLETGATGARVAYFIQCFTDRLFPSMAEATVRVLQACGANVVVPTSQHCCGLPACYSGDWGHAKTMAKATIESLEAAEADWIVTAGASCAVAITHDYHQLFADEPEWAARAEALAARTLDLTSFLTTVARLPDGALAAPGGEPVTYHNFCQSHNVLGLKEEPRALIERVMGLELVELPEAAVCCGFGGSVSADYPELSAGILARKLENVDRAGVRTLVTDNPGCIMHLRGGMDASGRTIRVLHLAELLDRRT